MFIHISCNIIEKVYIIIIIIIIVVVVVVVMQKLRDYSCQGNSVTVSENALTDTGVRSAFCEMVNG